MYILSNRKGNNKTPPLTRLYFTEQFWKFVIEWFTKKSAHARSLIITEELVIFGVQKNFVSDRVLDLIILMAKCQCKMLDS